MIGDKIYSKEEVEKFFNELRCEPKAGALSDQGIKKAIYDGDIFIYPFEGKCLTPIGYNFCPSEIIVSTRTGLPLAIYEKNGERYVMVGPNETVLVSTREYISISNRLMGTFHSKVKIVSAGFGHISTTLDAGWSGPLLIAINNPNSHKLKLTLSVKNEPVAFVTLVFYRFAESAKIKHDNPPYRTDVFDTYVARASHLKRIILGKAFSDYEEMVHKIHKSMDVNAAYGEKPPQLKELEESICQLKDMFILQYEAAKRRAVFEHFFRMLTKAETYKGFSSDMHSMLHYLYWGIVYFFMDPDKEIEKAQKDKFIEFLDICYLRVQKENIGQFWIKSYNEIKDISVTHRYRWKWGIGIRWRQVIMRSVVVAVLIIIVAAGSQREQWSLLQVVLAPMVSGLIGAFLLKWFSKS